MFSRVGSELFSHSEQLFELKPHVQLAIMIMLKFSGRGLLSFSTEGKVGELSDVLEDGTGAGT